MGTSTDAILFYGYVWDDEGTDRPWITGDDDDDDDDDDEEDWQERYAAARGVTRPSESYAEVLDHASRSFCEVGTHCSDSCPMGYVAVKASMRVARRGYPQTVSELEVGPSWADELRTFCADLGIPVDGKEPAWWLVSYWDS